MDDLRGGVCGVAQNGTVTPEQRQETLADARAWIESDARDWPFSLASICDELGLEVEDPGRAAACPTRWRGCGRGDGTPPPAPAG